MIRKSYIKIFVNKLRKKIDKKTKYCYTQENTNEMISDLSKKNERKRFQKERVSGQINNDINQTNNYFKLNF